MCPISVPSEVEKKYWIKFIQKRNNGRYSK